MIAARLGIGVTAMSVGGLILLGDSFFVLTASEQLAVIAHEQAHIDRRHALRRVWWLVTMQWRNIYERCREQEFEADRIAAQNGHAKGLLSFLSRLSPESDGSPLHPTPQERIESLTKEFAHVR